MRKTAASFALLLVGLVWLGAQSSPDAISAEDRYRLVHAIGNDEKEIARGLSKPECEARKREYKAVAEALGTYDEAAGYGSVTCLPESVFE